MKCQDKHGVGGDLRLSGTSAPGNKRLGRRRAEEAREEKQEKKKKPRSQMGVVLVWLLTYSGCRSTPPPTSRSDVQTPVALRPFSLRAALISASPLCVHELEIEAVSIHRQFRKTLIKCINLILYTTTTTDHQNKKQNVWIIKPNAGLQLQANFFLGGVEVQPIWVLSYRQSKNWSFIEEKQQKQQQLLMEISGDDSDDERRAEASARVLRQLKHCNWFSVTGQPEAWNTHTTLCLSNSHTHTHS